ncbi:AMP-dependent synthetase/ligase [Zestomonas carbonaria]|uniref:Long-chain-fatty-acid--CoA ligase FadD15 n=1 Tax=Zestomonas carbonaria TaxID=2762745 RepID=A0A7U7EM49_9GAMM|nr:AMP-dependent synthetase/ligase [Pseudomonas carbonaria]CAD5107554.1 Long-chain-fatty-acid--CoA ligase FadD15 [Pseudomonas carbonaria]
MTTQPQPPKDLPSIPALLAWRAANTPDWPAARQRLDTGQWQGLTWGEVAQRAEHLARALLAQGVQPGDRVVVWSRTRVEWSLLDFAILNVGAVSVGLYPSLSPGQAGQQLRRAGCKLLFVEHSSQALPLHGTFDELAVVCIDDALDGSGHLHLDEFLAGAENIPADEVEQRWQALGPQSLANLVFTSGTTGDPKAAMLGHGNLLAFVSRYTLPPARFSSLAFLPMAHVGERVIGHYLRLWCGAQATYVADINEVPRTLAEVQPDFFGSVPRLFEKFHAAVMAQRAALPPGKRGLLDWALRTGIQRARGEGNALSGWLARRLVLDKLRAKLFGPRITTLVGGGAPLDPALVEFYAALGLPLCEGWGMSESTAFLTSNEASIAKAGSVGKALPSTELRIAEDGEVLVRGPLVFQGYFGQPDKTAETFDEDGWLRSGDIGRIDEDGYLWLTGRKKELIITAGGKNIAPTPIEALLKQQPLVEQALVHGDRRKYLVALLALDPERLAAWARRKGLGGEHADWLRTQALRDELQAHIDLVNADLAQVERIKAWALLPRLLSQDEDELTPTQKLKRPVIEQHFAELLNSLYPVEEQRRPD